MRYLLVCILAITFVGCAAEPKHYNTGLSKNPTVLTLNPQGDYYLRKEGVMSGLWLPEHGEWWLINENVVLLLPDQDGKPEHYARISEERTPFGNLSFYKDLRPALANDPQSQRPAVLEMKDEQVDADEKQKGPNKELEEKRVTKDELEKLIAQLNPGPLSKEEYRSLTRHPYSRKPFLENRFASQAYFDGFRVGFAKRTREPGQITIWGKRSGSIIDAANKAGFSAGITGDLSQLTDAEKQEVNEWKQKYKDVSMWPYASIHQSELELLRELEGLDSQDGAE